MEYLFKAKEILSGCLFIPIEKISDDASLSDIQQMDSLTFESIITEVETFVGHEVDPVDLLDLASVKDLANLLQKNKS